MGKLHQMGIGATALAVASGQCMMVRICAKAQDIYVSRYIGIFAGAAHYATDQQDRTQVVNLAQHGEVMTDEVLGSRQVASS